jgi:hypothetical protein
MEEPNGIAFGPLAGFGGALYVGNSWTVPADVIRVDPSGRLTNFIDDGRIGSGLLINDVEFSPGGAWGEGGYFLQFTFTGQGCYCLHRFETNGSFTPSLFTFRDNANALRFAHGGPFGVDLYFTVSSPSGGYIVAMKPDGSTNIFASGFGGFGSLEFSEDGCSLYVADYFGNRIYRITHPPNLFTTSPANLAQFPVGSLVLIAGHASAVCPGNSLPLVTINSSPVDILDASGNFFTRVTLTPGQNAFSFTATDSFGQTATTNLTLIGVEPQPEQIDFDNLSDVSTSLAGEYGRTSFNEHTKTLYADLLMRNIGTYPVKAPLLVGLTRLSDPTVRVLNPDGLTPEGIPFYNLSALITSTEGEGGPTLNPQQATVGRTLAFSVPNREQFVFDLIILGQLNQAPAFTSVPVIEALVGRPYTYNAQAVDPDADPLAFSLVSGPTNLVIHPATGQVSWSTTTNDLGTRDVRLRVEDGRGGFAEQHYILSVILPPPNRPPFFTSVPFVLAYVNQPYVYDADASDPDADTLTYTLTSSPTNMVINQTNGLITWSPSVSQLLAL